MQNDIGLSTLTRSRANKRAFAVTKRAARSHLLASYGLQTFMSFSSHFPAVLLRFHRVLVPFCEKTHRIFVRIFVCRMFVSRIRMLVFAFVSMCGWESVSEDLKSRVRMRHMDFRSGSNRQKRQIYGVVNVRKGQKITLGAGKVYKIWGL